MKVISQTVQALPYNPGLKPPRSCWPDPTQLLLLRACLLDPARAVPAWEAWRARVDPLRLDHGSNRLMSLLYRNLERAGVTSPDTPRLKGNWRYHWANNTRFIHELKPWLDTFAAAGIEPLMLKGIALLSGFYPDSGCRLMADYDLLVRETDAPAASDLLRGLGYVAQFPHQENNFHSIHGLGFIKRGHTEIDLHWHVLHDDVRHGVDAHFWEHSQVRRLEHLSFRTLGHEDMLLHVCEHGMRWLPETPLRWLADTWCILHAPDAHWDLHYLERWARFHGVSLPLRLTLQYLRDQVGLSPSHPVLAVLPELRPRLTEYVEYPRRVWPKTWITNRLNSPLVWLRKTHPTGSGRRINYLDYYVKIHRLPGRRAAITRMIRNIIGLGNAD